MERIHTYETQVRTAEGRTFVAHAEGHRRDDGRWEGYLTFEPLGGAWGALRTERETTQADREALAYWAGGLEPVYLSGALARAR
jgi:hypothetical protein